MPPGRYGDWETAAEVAQAYEAELLALRLREAGIEVQVLDSSFEQVPIPQSRSFEIVRVLVPSASVAEARRILAENVDLPEDFEPPSEGGGREPEG